MMMMMLPRGVKKKLHAESKHGKGGKKALEKMLNCR